VAEVKTGFAEGWDVVCIQRALAWKLDLPWSNVFFGLLYGVGRSFLETEEPYWRAFDISRAHMVGSDVGWQLYGVSCAGWIGGVFVQHQISMSRRGVN